jgi:tripartite-type tricarboxylate transporter receptor subunit TctC
VPTFAEVGFPAVISTSWFGLAAPAATPADIIARLEQAMRQAFSAPEYQAALTRIGFEQFTLDADQSTAFIRREIDKWSAVAKAVNIQVE